MMPLSPLQFFVSCFFLFFITMLWNSTLVQNLFRLGMQAEETGLLSQNKKKIMLLNI